MPPHTISRDLKARIPVLFYEQQFNIDRICHCLGIKKTLVYKTLQYFRVYGTPHNPHTRTRGRNRVLSYMDINFITVLVEQRHCIYLDEICQALSEHRSREVSTATLSHALHRLNFSQKRVSIKAQERNEIPRAVYMNRIADIVTHPDMLMFIDEAARDRRTSGRPKGWASVGWHCVQHRYFVRGQRYSILPILTIDGILTHDIIPGSATSEQFLQFLRDLVIPLTNPSPGPRSVLILDNCSIHVMFRLAMPGKANTQRTLPGRLCWIWTFGT
jgi:transposase